MNYELTIDMFYAACKDVIKYFPRHEMMCKWPHTFAVMDNITNLNTDTLGAILADKNRPYFYSRVWENTQYSPSGFKRKWPAVVFFETNFNKNSIFKDKAKTTYNLEVMVLDTYPEKHLSSEGCQGRTKNEIYRDTESILDSFLLSMKGFGFWNTNEGIIFSHRDVIQSRLNVSSLTTANPLTRETNSWFKDLQGANLDVQGHRVDGSTVANLYGTVCRLNVPMLECQMIDLYLTSRPDTDIINPECC